MPRSHTHLDGGPPCRFPTIKRCDENWTQFLHGHLGRPCVKQFQESKSKRGRMNSIATCTLVTHSPTGQSFAAAIADAIAQAPQEWRDELAAWKRTQEVD